MKTIGLIGGMSWESTRIYYELINSNVQRQLGGIHSARMLITSLDMADIADMQKNGQWREAGELLANQAVQLQQAGAAVIALATNTMHKCAPQILAAISVPFAHIVDALVAQLKLDKRHRPLLLATRFTMEDEFYRGRLATHGFAVMLPSPPHRDALHEIIFTELCKGIVTEKSRRAVIDMIVAAKQSGADSVILGCTEVCMLVNENNSSLCVYDTTQIHATALVDFALSS